MKIGVLIEARMSSTRLPGKVLMKIRNKTMLGFIVDRIKLVKKIKNIVVATTINKNDDKIVKWCEQKKISYYRGSENNVINRVYQAAKKYKLDIIVLITGDCPLVDHNIISQILNVYLKNNFDYVSNAHIRTYPDGMDVQVINFNSLEKSNQIAKSNLEKEHVTLNIRRNPKIFKHLYVMAPDKLHLPKLGLTLDEKEDFILIKKIINHFYKKKNYSFSCEQIVDLLKIKKNWIKINSLVKRKGDT